MPVSNGSGFIVREDGLILSNAHVVANRSNVVVQLKDGRRFDGIVQAVDHVSDLATIKINAVRFCGQFSLKRRGTQGNHNLT